MKMQIHGYSLLKTDLCEVNKEIKMFNKLLDLIIEAIITHN